MTPHEIPARSEPIERRAGAFLVRIWREPSGGEEGPGPIRCFVRDLKTGHEEYLEGPVELVRRLTGAIEESDPGAGLAAAPAH